MRKLLAVGTTSVRRSESYARLRPAEAEFQSDLFIFPGFRFQLVDRLLTNFHLPQSSLFILVAGSSDSTWLKKPTAEAVENCHRFFSYGDAMLIWARLLFPAWAAEAGENIGSTIEIIV